MGRLNSRIDTLAMQTIWCIFLLAISAAASTTGTNYTVKADGGGNYTTIQACASAMSAGDTCTVYAGTYSESPNIPAGTAGNYKTITVNGKTLHYTATVGTSSRLVRVHYHKPVFSQEWGVCRLDQFNNGFLYR